MKVVKDWTRGNKQVLRQRGISAIELMMSLGIAIVVIIGVLALINNSRQQARVMTETNNLQAIVAKVKATFAGRQSYAGLSNTMLINQEGFPSNMVEGTTVTHAWGGSVTVTPAAGNASVNIVYAAVPTAACIDLVNNAARYYNTITVGSTLVKAATAAQNDVALTNTACSAAATVNVTFNFV